MIRFGNIHIEGYRSILEHEEDLSNPGIYLLKAKNGFGKSTFLETIFWVLYGKLLKEDTTSVNTWKKYRPKDYKGTKVEIFWQGKKSSVNKVIRCSKYTGQVEGSKGGDRLLYYQDGVLTEEKDKRKIQKLIEKDLGMSPNLFKNAVIFAQGSKRLIKESNSDKKDIFEEIVSLQFINEARAKSIENRKGLINHKKDLEDELKDITNKADSYKSTYKRLLESEKEYEKSFNKRKKRAKSYIEELKSNKPSKPNILEGRSIEQEEGSLNDTLTTLKKEYNLRSSSIDAVSNIDGLNNLINEIEHYLDIKKEKKVRKLLEDLRSSINFVNSYNEKKNTILDGLRALDKKRSTLMNLSDKYDKYVSNLERARKELKEVLNDKPEVKSSKYLKLYEDIRSSEKPVLLELEGINAQIEDYNWLVDDALGNKGIKSYIMESSLVYLNKCLTEFGRLIGINIEFGIDLNSVKKDFYTLIEINGNIVEYSELSGGQQQLVNIVMALAIHESTSMSKDINLLFMDELFENLDSDNIELVSDLLSSMFSKTKSLWVITHHEGLIINNAKTKLLDYKNGITTFL